MVIGQWYHIAVTCDRDGNMTVYKNNTSKGTVDISSRSSDDCGAGSGSWVFGEPDATTGEMGQFALADFRIFKGTALSGANVTTLYNSGLNPATHIGSNGEPNYADSGNSLSATTWWKLGNANASGTRTTAPALDLTDSSSGSLTLTNTGGVKAGTIFMTKSSGSYTITDSNDPTILNWRNAKINQNSGTELYVSSASQFSGRITLD